MKKKLIRANIRRTKVKRTRKRKEKKRRMKRVILWIRQTRTRPKKRRREEMTQKSKAKLIHSYTQTFILAKAK